MRVALDTNRLTDLFQGDAALAEWLGICDEVWSPLIVLGELNPSSSRDRRFQSF
jgi:predicted nucleic acid-binding protein